MFFPIHTMVNKTKYLKATEAVYFTIMYWAASVTGNFDTFSACFSRNCPGMQKTENLTILVHKPFSNLSYSVSGGTAFK
jgi:hypothetical protein